MTPQDFLGKSTFDEKRNTAQVKISHNGSQAVLEKPYFEDKRKTAQIFSARNMISTKASHADLGSRKPSFDVKKMHEMLPRKISRALILSSTS